MLAAPSVLALQHFGVKFEAKYPNLKKYADLVMTRPSVAATVPPHWAGTPNPTFLASV